MTGWISKTDCPVLLVTVVLTLDDWKMKHFSLIMMKSIEVCVSPAQLKDAQCFHIIAVFPRFRLDCCIRTP